MDLAPLGGIAGDMFAAAVFDAFPSLYDHFLNDIKNLEVAGLSAELEERLCNGLKAAYFNVHQQTDLSPPRTLAKVTNFLNSKNLDDNVIRHAIGIFSLLAGAEAEVHGKTIETIHFHEVSDWDSMIDIVAAAGIIARLKCKTWRVGALPLGSGTVKTAHGDIPVPAPATVALLKDFNWHDDGISGERVTPTGAAILAYLGAQPSDSGAKTARLLASGSGCGTREMQGCANILRAVAFAAVEENINSDEVVRVAFEVDDMTAEEIAWATDNLREEKGVLDVSCLSMQAKKGRVSTGIRILVQPDTSDAIINQCFQLTSTIGIRHENIHRKILPRMETQVNHPQADAMGDGMRVKCVTRPGFSAKTDSDGLASAATLQERRILAAQLQNAALDKLKRDKLKKETEV